MVLAGNKAKHLSLFNHTTKTIHVHHSSSPKCRSPQNMGDDNLLRWAATDKVTLNFNYVVSQAHDKLKTYPLPLSLWPLILAGW